MVRHAFSNAKSGSSVLTLSSKLTCCDSTNCITAMPTIILLTEAIRYLVLRVAGCWFLISAKPIVLICVSVLGVISAYATDGTSYRSAIFAMSLSSLLKSWALFADTDVNIIKSNSSIDGVGAVGVIRCKSFSLKIQVSRGTFTVIGASGDAVENFCYLLLWGITNVVFTKSHIANLLIYV